VPGVPRPFAQAGGAHAPPTHMVKLFSHLFAAKAPTYRFPPEPILEAMKIPATVRQEMSREAVSLVRRPPELEELLHGIYSVKRGQSSMDIYFENGEVYPDSRKALLVYLAAGDLLTRKDRAQLAYAIGHHREREDWSAVILAWLPAETDEKARRWLIYGLGFYLEKPAARVLLLSLLSRGDAVAGQATLSFLDLRDHIDGAPADFWCEVWAALEANHGALLSDSRQKALVRAATRNLSAAVPAAAKRLDRDEVWLWEIPNPWSFPFEIFDPKVPERYGFEDEPQEFVMGGPTYGDLHVGGQLLSAIGGPLVLSDDGRVLCCTQLDDSRVYHLILIETRTGKVQRTEVTGILLPWKMDNGLFVVFVNPDHDGPLDVRAAVRVPPPETFA
jgi:hypothetical protein